MRKNIVFKDKNDAFEIPIIPKALIFDYKWLVFKDKYLLRDPFTRLKHIYKFIDRYNKFVATFTVCQKGCSHCCKIDVDVTSLEAEYIFINTGLKADTGNNVTKKHRTPCPFLGEQGECRIYKYRPFNCRTFHTIDDPKYCEIGDEAHMVYGASSFGYGSSMLMNCAMVIRHINNGLPNRDIRDFFKKH